MVEGFEGRKAAKVSLTWAKQARGTAEACREVVQCLVGTLGTQAGSSLVILVLRDLRGVPESNSSSKWGFKQVAGRGWCEDIPGGVGGCFAMSSGDPGDDR